MNPGRFQGFFFRIIFHISVLESLHSTHQVLTYESHLVCEKRKKPPKKPTNVCRAVVDHNVLQNATPVLFKAVVSCSCVSQNGAPTVSMGVSQVPFSRGGWVQDRDDYGYRPRADSPLCVCTKMLQNPRTLQTSIALCLLNPKSEMLAMQIRKNLQMSRKLRHMFVQVLNTLFL